MNSTLPGHDAAGDRGDALRGAVAALVVGAFAILVGGRTDQLRVLLDEPTVVAIGLAIAVVAGAALAGRTIRASLAGSIAIAIVYGVAVPAVVAAFVALPVAPLAIAFSVVAWPVTIPAALAWLALLRWTRTRARLGGAPTVGVVPALVAVLLVLRFTQPAFSVSAAGAWCVSFPGEQVESLAWSPDGDWLGLGSEDSNEGVVRVIERRSRRIIELARGPYVDAALTGVAVGPGGAVTYVVDKQGASVRSGEEDTAIWMASPSEAARRVAGLPTPALADLTWTPDGIAAVLWVDPQTWTEISRLVWVRPNARADLRLEPMEPDRIAAYPILAPLADPDADLVMRTPNGERTVTRPRDAAGDIGVSRDGAFIVFQARALTADGMDELYNHLVVQATDTDRRIVLAEEDTWSPILAPHVVAYITAPWMDGNQVCIQDIPTP